MPLFGHTESGHAIDVWEHPDINSYIAWASVAAGSDFDAWHIVELRPGTVAGAKDNGDGTFTNPDVQAVVPLPILLSKTAFNKFGWAQVGMARHQAILEAAKNRAGTADLDYEIRAAYEQYVSAAAFQKSEVQALSDLLIAGAIMTSAEQGKYMDNWPTG